MSTVMRPSKTLSRVFIYRDPIDFRKAHRGLAAIVETALGHNLFDGYLYAFTNRQRNKIKCLFSAIAPASMLSWEDNGSVLYYKSLSEEKFKWQNSVSDRKEACPYYVTIKRWGDNNRGKSP